MRKLALLRVFVSVKVARVRNVENMKNSGTALYLTKLDTAYSVLSNLSTCYLLKTRKKKKDNDYFCLNKVMNLLYGIYTVFYLHSKNNLCDSTKFV